MRSIVLGTVAVFAAIAWLATKLDMNSAELAGYALTSVVLVLGMVLLAAAVTGLVWVFGWLLRRRRDR
jgi:hypothetical protein